MSVRLEWGFDPEERRVLLWIVMPMVTDYQLATYEGVGATVEEAIEGLIVSGAVQEEDRERQTEIAREFFEAKGVRWDSAS